MTLQNFYSLIKPLSLILLFCSWYSCFLISLVKKQTNKNKNKQKTRIRAIVNSHQHIYSFFCPYVLLSLPLSCDNEWMDTLYFFLKPAFLLRTSPHTLLCTQGYHSSNFFFFHWGILFEYMYYIPRKRILGFFLLCVFTLVILAFTSMSSDFSSLLNIPYEHIPMILFLLV